MTTQQMSVQKKADSRSAIFKFSCLGLAVSMALVGCGGSGGGGSSAGGSSSLSGAVIDAAIPGAQVTITLNAPLGQSGAQTIGSISADAQGQFTVNVALPNTNAPVFANASDPAHPSTVLSSYLGVASQLLAAGTLSSSQLPDLDITQVTTAALALYASQNGGSYASLTPATYGNLLNAHRDDILPLAAGIQAVVDGHCGMPAGILHTDDLADAIIKASTLAGGSSGVLSATATMMGGSCQATLQNLMQSIAANSIWAPQMESNDLTSQTLVPAGSYDLQGVLAQMSAYAAGTSSASVALPAPEVFHDAQIQVSSTGQVTSTDGLVSGQIQGHFLQLTLTDSSGQSYAIGGHLAPLPSTEVNGPAVVYSLRSGGSSQSSNQPARFDAVLVPAGETPLWTGLNNSSDQGVACSTGFGVRMMTMGPTIGGISAGICVLPSATGLTLTPATGSISNQEDSLLSMPSSLTSLFTAIQLSEVLLPGSAVSSTPFILSAQAAMTTPTVSGQGALYYVMGADDVLFQVSTAAMTLNGSLLVSNQNLGDLIDH